MNKEILKKELKELQLRKDKLSYLFEKEFETEKEFYKFKEQNINDFNELKLIKEEINKLEWELMSEKERQEHLEYLQKLKEKYADD